jgi:hypothetical protein
VLLGHIGANTTFNEESALSRKTARRHAPFTVVTVDTVELGSVVSTGEWLDLDLKYKPSVFVSMSNEELVRRYRVSRNAEKFRQYQCRYVSQLQKVSDKKSWHQGNHPLPEVAI